MALNLDFLNSTSGAGTGPDDSMAAGGFRSDAGSSTTNLHADTGFVLPRVKDVRLFFSFRHNSKSPFFKKLTSLKN